MKFGKPWLLKAKPKPQLSGRAGPAHHYAEHTDTLRSMENLAATYRNQGRWNEAEQLEVQVMEKRKKLLGAEHPDTCRIHVLAENVVLIGDG